eukprot:Rhum_TRINITY_DN8190_c0_g1::Rhum_TRINITY_DN8190_c0_g1_i2::g.26635::m.26635
MAQCQGWQPPEALPAYSPLVPASKVPQFLDAVLQEGMKAECCYYRIVNKVNSRNSTRFGKRVLLLFRSGTVFVCRTSGDQGGKACRVAHVKDIEAVHYHQEKPGGVIRFLLKLTPQDELSLVWDTVPDARNDASEFTDWGIIPLLHRARADVSPEPLVCRATSRAQILQLTNHDKARCLDPPRKQRLLLMERSMADLKSLCSAPVFKHRSLADGTEEAIIKLVRPSVTKPFDVTLCRMAVLAGPPLLQPYLGASLRRVNGAEVASAFDFRRAVTVDPSTELELTVGLRTGVTLRPPSSVVQPLRQQCDFCQETWTLRSVRLCSWLAESGVGMFVGSVLRAVGGVQLRNILPPGADATANLAALDAYVTKRLREDGSVVLRFKQRDGVVICRHPSTPVGVVFDEAGGGLRVPDAGGIGADTPARYAELERFAGRTIEGLYLNHHRVPVRTRSQFESLTQFETVVHILATPSPDADDDSSGSSGDDEDAAGGDEGEAEAEAAVEAAPAPPPIETHDAGTQCHEEAFAPYGHGAVGALRTQRTEELWYMQPAPREKPSVPAHYLPSPNRQGAVAAGVFKHTELLQSLVERQARNTSLLDMLEERNDAADRRALSHES